MLHNKAFIKNKLNKFEIVWITIFFIDYSIDLSLKKGFPLAETAFHIFKSKPDYFVCFALNL